MLWHLEIRPGPGEHDAEGRRLAVEAAELGLPGPWHIQAGRGFLIEGDLSASDLRRAAEEVLVDRVVERYEVHARGATAADADTLVHVLPKPGVTDPEAESARAVLRDLGFPVAFVRTVRTYHVAGPPEALPRLIAKVLANDAVEQAVLGPIQLEHLGQGSPTASAS